jgi:predicted nucleic acid-binding protein
MYTIDASVWVNSYIANEPGHDTSVELLKLIFDRRLPLHLPTLVIPEVVGSLARRIGNAELADTFGKALNDLPDITWHTLDLNSAHAAAHNAAAMLLRGGDAIYASVAKSTGSILVSLDAEQRSRASSVVPARSPQEIVALRM